MINNFSTRISEFEVKIKENREAFASLKGINNKKITVAEKVSDLVDDFKKYLVEINTQIKRNPRQLSFANIKLIKDCHQNLFNITDKIEKEELFDCDPESPSSPTFEQVLNNKASILQMESTLFLGYLYQGDLLLIKQAIENELNLEHLSCLPPISESVLQHLFNAKLSKEKKIEILTLMKPQLNGIFLGFFKERAAVQAKSQKFTQSLAKDEVDLLEKILLDDLWQLPHDVSKEHLEIFMKLGINVNLKMQAGKTFLHQLLKDYPQKGSVEYLLENFPLLAEQTDENGNSAFHEVMKLIPSHMKDRKSNRLKKNLSFFLEIAKAFEKLENFKGILNQANSKGGTPLHVLCEATDFYYKNGYDEHPYMNLFIRNQILERMQWLLGQGALIQKDLKGYLPIAYTLHNPSLIKAHQMLCEKDLLKTAFPLSELNFALQNNLHGIIHLIFKNYGAHKDLNDEFFNPMLKDLSLFKDHIETLVLFIEELNKLSIISANFTEIFHLFLVSITDRRQALKIAIRVFFALKETRSIWGLESVFQTLLKDPNDFNNFSEQGQTFAHEMMQTIALYFENEICDSSEKLKKVSDQLIQVLSMLSKAGIKVHYPNQEEKLPLYYAIKHCTEKNVRFNICQVLMQLDGNKTRFPKQEFHLALENGWQDILELILAEYGSPDLKAISALLLPLAGRGEIELLAMFINFCQLDDVEVLNQIYENLAEDPAYGLMDNRVALQFRQYAKSTEEYSSNQKYYNRKCYEAIKHAAEIGFYQHSFQEVIEELARARQQIALQLEKFNRPSLGMQFGKKRNKESSGLDLETPLIEKYLPYKMRIEQLNELKTPHLKKEFVPVQVFGETHDGNKIPLTRLTKENFEHTHKNHVEKVLAEVGYLIDQIKEKKSAENIHLLLQDIGRIYWWMSQGTPWGRGSAAIADMLSKALLMHHGYYPVKWIEGIIPDCEVLVSPSVDDFVKRFPDLLESIPLKLSEVMPKFSSPTAKHDLRSKLESYLKVDFKEKISKSSEPLDPSETLPAVPQLLLND